MFVIPSLCLVPGKKLNYSISLGVAFDLVIVLRALDGNKIN